MPKMIILRGFPASGKSTYAKELVTSSPFTTVRINRDLLRDMLNNTRIPDTQPENLVTIAEKAQAEALLKAGVDVVIDAMNLKASYVRDWAALARKVGAEVVIEDQFLSISLEECLYRNSRRTGADRLPDSVITDLFRRFHPVKPVDLSVVKLSGIEPYVPDTSLPKVWLIDVDGTITTGPHNRTPFEWMKVHQDKPNAPVIKMVRALRDVGFDLVFVSGRDEICRDLTIRWIEKEVGIPRDDFHLIMREHADNRYDYVVKLELFDRYIRNDYWVIGAIDDRKQVVDAYREYLGLTVMQVAEGNF